MARKVISNAPATENSEETHATAETCNCNALPYPHVHDASGIHGLEE